MTIMVRAFSLALFLSLPAWADTLSVGTTGDYQPVSWWNAEAQEFEGIDIDLIKAFADEHGHSVEFVRTSWPTLMSDLQTGKFAIAVGGISHTPERANVALTSATIHLDGKVALVRCGEEQAYGSLAEIDQPSVRVVENPGGTNERFARATLRHASLEILEDNHAPFRALLSHSADVMFTDALEATFKESEGKGLCAVNADKPYTKIHKVFLFAKGEDALVKSFNTWLEGRPRD
jgi:cyclohexadienyl dehydratase